MNDTNFPPNNLQAFQRIKLSPTLNESQALQKLFDILFINIDATEPKLWTNEKENRVFNMAAIRHYIAAAKLNHRCRAASPEAAGKVNPALSRRTQVAEGDSVWPL